MKAPGVIAPVSTMTATTDTDLPAMRALLAHAQSRWRLRLVLQGLVLSIVIGLGVLCTQQALAMIFHDSSRWAPALFGTPLLDNLALSGFVFVGGVALAVLFAFLAAPDLSALARAADRHFLTQERL